MIDATPCIRDETDSAALNTLMLQLLRVTHIVGIDEAQTRPTAISFRRRCILRCTEHGQREKAAQRYDVILVNTVHVVS